MQGDTYQPKCNDDNTYTVTLRDGSTITTPNEREAWEQWQAS